MVVLSAPIEVEAASPNAATCAVSATGLNFGVYDPLSAAPLVATGQVTVTCGLAGGMAVRVSLATSYSIGSGGSYALRTMRAGANPLNYNLFFDAAFTQICGDGYRGFQARPGGVHVEPTNTDAEHHERHLWADPGPAGRSSRYLYRYDCSDGFLLSEWPGGQPQRPRVAAGLNAGGEREAELQ